MAHPITMHAVSHHAAAIIFVNLSCGLFGVPALTEALLIVSGVLSAGGDGSLVAPFAAAVLGSIVGMSASFSIGRHARRWSTSGDRRGASWAAPFDRAAATWRRFGAWSILFGYFTPGVRHLAAAAAGASGMDRRRFVALAVAGASAWSGVLLMTGRITGDVRTAATAAHEWSVVCVTVVALVALAVSTRTAAFSLRHWIARRQRAGS